MMALIYALRLSKPVGVERWDSSATPNLEILWVYDKV